jgi:hypothetical protein
MCAQVAPMCLLVKVYNKHKTAQRIRDDPEPTVSSLSQRLHIAPAKSCSLKTLFDCIIVGKHHRVKRCRQSECNDLDKGQGANELVRIDGRMCGGSLCNCLICSSRDHVSLPRLTSELYLTCI